MYNIAFYENGRFCTHLGSPLRSLPEALEQIKLLTAGLKAEELTGLVGVKFDREGTVCGILITTEFGEPIREVNFNNE